jgi:hypothetical protein
VSGIDDVEYANLAEQVRRIELLVNADARSDSSYLLKSFLHNAKSRMEEIRHEEIRAEDDKKDQKAKETASVVHLAEMEYKLNSEEKQQYSQFLKLDYFTKANFDELEEFYEKSWDKLSESGKNQMSARVWEGIKRKEYTFDELPVEVRKKESERIYLQLTGKIEPSSSLQNISPEVRANFVREYDAGNDQATTKILSGRDFAEYSLDTRNASAFKADASAKEKTTDGKEKPTKGSFEGIGSLEGLAFGDATEVSKPNLPPITGSKAVEKSLTHF